MTEKDTNNGVEYVFEDVKAKPERAYKKSSKYDPILNTFIESTVNQVGAVKKLAVLGKDANYMRTQLKKIIDNDNLPVKASVVNNELYLERIQVKKIT
jgi:antitoxin component of RelBE/YafQ-DinJ toxin-antitoxin module